MHLLLDSTLCIMLFTEKLPSQRRPRKFCPFCEAGKRFQSSKRTVIFFTLLSTQTYPDYNHLSLAVSPQVYSLKMGHIEQLVHL